MISLAIASVLAIGGALYALGAKELMRAMLGLCALFVGVAIAFASAGAWLLAAGQVFLFVGGVVTLLVLAFSGTHTPTQHPASFEGGIIATIVLVTLTLALPQGGNAVTTDITSVFASYGWVLDIAVLVLVAAVIGSRHLMEGRA